MSAVVAFIFKGINFALFGAVAYYAFRKYGIPLIRQQMRDKEIARQNIVVAQHELDHELALSAQHAHEEIERKRILLEKVQQWQQAFTAQQHIHAQEQGRRKTLLQQRVASKNQDLVRYYETIHIMPQVITTLHKDLSHYFAQPERGNTYNNAIIEQLSKRT